MILHSTVNLLFLANECPTEFCKTSRVVGQGDPPSLLFIQVMEALNWIVPKMVDGGILNREIMF